ncbi:MAG: tRNA 5-methoxyuridine(34)/uridine 5-oxyacetic acid(34) synthase CmoB [Gammaproteobacteria bacterium]|nr:tRNA 5-methoxyuridine(34)/uridine 5-oxyacetic acid(34) synthase CmoB [Gammaproteobacteria bacterium]
MIAANAKQVIGIDPTPLYCMQHLAIQHFLQDDRNWVLPLRVEEIPKNPKFDAVFSMGVIYHRNDPRNHVRQIFDLTQTGGRAVIESIVTMHSTSIFPENRYARMRNISCIPDQRTLVDWCLEAGFRDVKLIDVSKTTSTEQRSTKWMVFESLKEALDPTDSTKTVEGYPAPIRAAILAYK